MKDAILVLLWCVACASAQCSNATICVASGTKRESDCPASGSVNYSSLFSLSANEIKCKNVQIYFTGGSHILSRDLVLNDMVEVTEIIGASYSQPSIIECWNNAGIRFSENRKANEVEISNMIFLHCQRNTIAENLAALYLRNALFLLSGVTVNNTEGWGLYADNCYEQRISNCIFANNKGNIKFKFDSNMTNLVEINETKILDSSDSSGISANISGVECFFTIVNCDFQRNLDGHLLITTNPVRTWTMTIVILNSTFNSSNQFGVKVNFWEFDRKTVFLRNSVISNNQVLGLHLENIAHAEISDCSFTNNMQESILITSLYGETLSAMSKVYFSNNYRAITVFWKGITNNQIRISECSFEDHTGSWVVLVAGTNNDALFIESSSFLRSCSISDYSVLEINAGSLTLNDVNISECNCTAIAIYHSKVYLYNFVNLTSNHGRLGGGLYLESSKLIFTSYSKLFIINNTAEYGGGVFLTKDECIPERERCFFQFEDEENLTELIEATGNSAERAGDITFGGCLSDCYIEQENGDELILSKCDFDDYFWYLVYSTKIISQSTFVEQQRNVVFCTNTTTSIIPSCNDSHTIAAYRGQVFTVPLMVADDCCFPSVELIEAYVMHSGSEGESPIQFKHYTIHTGRKYCHKFPYALIGGFGLGREMAVTVQLRQHLHHGTSPAVLKVFLKDCPAGFVLNSESGECGCKDIMKAYQIECNPSNLSLLIPAQTWVGELVEVFALQSDCQFCKNEESHITSNIDTRESTLLCIGNRAGIMCGACLANYSLLLGGYECADCSNSTYKGVLLFIAFIALGIALVLLLLCLNLTVSTGMINGLIFYSNIVYLNSNTLLPITGVSNSTHLLNAVRILSTFQAWMNLDFGIVTCFFDGYDTYISTLMQLVFPLYIWLLILTIVLTSRYSSRIGKITTSNTVPVLATLLLLSFSKLLKTSIEAFSYVQLQLFDGNVSQKLWKPDANIPYLGQRHLPIFLLSSVIIMVYVVPFTLLILLVPLLQTKSHYKVLKWIYILKPFFDAFYGPYTRRYRYWPGILLLARVIILAAFSFYSPDIPLQLLVVIAMAAALLVLWMMIGKINSVSLYRRKTPNYLELFTLLNLLIFAAFSKYTIQFPDSNIQYQQRLAVAMVGSVLFAFCNILGYRIFIAISKCRVIRKLFVSIPVNISRQKKSSEVCQNPTPQQVDVSPEVTHTLVDVTGHDTPSDEVREPLLTN